MFREAGLGPELIGYKRIEQCVARWRGLDPTDDGKALTNDQAITLYLPKGDLVFPISQHIGAPAKPEVHKGDKVLVGQIIASATRAVSANVISSVSGTVKAIEPRLLASGMAVTSIVVENDGLYSAVPDMGRQRDYTQLSPAEIRANPAVIEAYLGH